MSIPINLTTNSKGTHEKTLHEFQRAHAGSMSFAVNKTVSSQRCLLYQIDYVRSKKNRIDFKICK